jgi:hypothetical protein
MPSILAGRHHIEKKQIGFDHAGAVQHQFSKAPPTFMGTKKEAARTIVIAEKIVPEDKPLPESVRRGRGRWRERVRSGDNMRSAMQHWHVGRKFIGQGFIGRGGVRADFIRIDPRHEQCRDGDLSGYPRRDIGMKRHFLAYGDNILGNRFDIVEHQGNARGPGLGEHAGFLDQTAEILCIMLRIIIKSRCYPSKNIYIILI